METDKCSHLEEKMKIHETELRNLNTDLVNVEEDIEETEKSLNALQKQHTEIEAEIVQTKTHLDLLTEEYIRCYGVVTPLGRNLLIAKARQADKKVGLRPSPEPFAPQENPYATGGRTPQKQTSRKKRTRKTSKRRTNKKRQPRTAQA